MPWLPGAVLDDRDASAGPEPRAQRIEVRNAVGEVVVGVAQEDQIDARGGQARVVRDRFDDLDVRAPLVARALAQVLEHVGIDVDRVDAAGRADRVGEPEREVAAARAEIRHLRARRDRERRDHAFGLLLLVAADAGVGVALHGAAAREEGEREQCDRDG